MKTHFFSYFHVMSSTSSLGRRKKSMRLQSDPESSFLSLFWPSRLCSFDVSLKIVLSFRWGGWKHHHLSVQKMDSRLAGWGRAWRLSWACWLRVTEASCSMGAVPPHFHFIYLFLLPFFPSSAGGPTLPPHRAALRAVSCGGRKRRLFVSLVLFLSSGALTPVLY